jgi:hypothetical protein
MVQVLCGIQAGKDVKLSNIARSLNEEIPLIKTESRLSRSLGGMDLTESINGGLIAEGSKRIEQESVIALETEKYIIDSIGNGVLYSKQESFPNWPRNEERGNSYSLLQLNSLEQNFGASPVT